MYRILFECRHKILIVKFDENVGQTIVLSDIRNIHVVN